MKETYNEQSWGRFKELMQKLTKRLAATSIKADLFDDRLTKAEEELDEINDITTGINLLRGTRDFVVGTTKDVINPNFYTDGFYLKNATVEKDSTGFSYVINNTASALDAYTSSIADVKPKDSITFAFDYKITNKAQMANNGLAAIRVYNGTTQESMQTIAVNLDSVVENVWTTHVFTFVVPDSFVPGSWVLAPYLRVRENGIISFRKCCLYRGRIEHPEWSASPFDVLQKGDAESGNISFPIRVDQGGTGATSLKGAQDALGISSINDYTTGINLIRGTRDFILGTQTSTEISQSRYDGFNNRGKFTFSKGLEGFTVASVAQSGLSSDNPQYLHSSLVRLDDPTEYITISTEFMVDDATAWDSKILFSLVLSGVSSWKNITISDTGVSNIESGVWKRITYRFTPSSYGSNGEWLVLNLLLVRNGSIHFRKTGVYKGKINDPIWSPAPADLSLEPVNDITTGINLARQTRDIIAGTQKLGSYICSDGFYIQGSVIFSKDDQGYGVAYCNAEQRSIWTSNVKGGKAGEWYTFAFEVKFDSVALTDSWNLSNISVRTQDWTTTVQTTSTNVGDLKKRVGTLEAGKWYQVINYILLNADVKDNELFYGYTSISRDLIALGVSYRKAGFYKGRIENPEWSASPFDVLQKGDAESGNISFPIRLDQGGTGATSLKGAQDALGISSINDITTGINLLRGTRDFNLGTIAETNVYFKDGFNNQYANFTFFKDEDGFTVAHKENSGSTTNQEFRLISSLTEPINPGEKITISFEVKIDKNIPMDIKHLIVVQPVNADNYNSGTNVLLDYSAVGLDYNTMESEKWYKGKYIYTVPDQFSGVPSRVNVRLMLMRNGSVYYKKLNIQKGEINKPIWSPAPADLALEPVNDITTGINLLRGTRDFTRGNDYVYQNSSSYMFDGFAISDPWVKSTREDGFGVISIKRSGLTANSVTVIHSSLAPCKKGDEFTLAVDFMSEDLSGIDDNVIVSTLVYPENSNTNVQSFDIRKPDVEFNGQWVTLIQHITVTAENAAYINPRARCGRNGSMNFCKFRLYKGHINNPEWSASPFDIDRINDITTGINLLRGTRDFVIGDTSTFTSFGWDNGFRQLTSNGTYQYKKDNEGFTVANISRTGAVSPGAIQLLSSVAQSFKKGDILTVSFEFMVDDESKWDTRTDIGGIRFVDKSNTTINGFSFNQNTFPIIKDAESKKWYQCVTTITCAGVEGNDYGVYYWVGMNQNGSLNFRKLALYKGYIENPEWSASPFDVASSYDVNQTPIYIGHLDNAYQIPDKADLNDYNIAGTYRVTANNSAQSLLHCPVTEAFKMVVEYSQGYQSQSMNNGIRQRIVVYNDSAREFIRYRGGISNDWTSWRQTYANESIRPLEGGGTGASTGRQGLANLLANGTTLGAVSSLSGVMVAGVDYIDPSTTTDNPGLGYGLVLTLSRKATSDPMAVMVQLAIATNGCAYRTKTGSTPTWSPWYRMTTTAISSSPGLEGPSVETYPAESLEEDSQIATLESRIKSLEKTLIDNGLMLADDQSL